MSADPSASSRISAGRGNSAGVWRMLRLHGAVRLLVLVMACWAAGCAATSQSKSSKERGLPELSDENKNLARGYLAAVEIRGHSRVTVQDTVDSVFTAAGLAVVTKDRDRIVFERPATQTERGAYGTWFGDDLRVRLRVEFTRQAGGVEFVRCSGLIARDAGTRAEDEQPMSRRRLRNYAELLDEVSSRLN